MKSMLLLAALAAISSTVGSHAVRADALVAADWVTSNFDSTGNDSGNTNLYGAPAQNGAGITVVLPTNTTGNWAHSNGGGTGFTALEHLAYVGGPSDLGGTTGLSATFSINDTASVTSFTTGNFAGELNGSNAPSESVLLYLKSGANDPGAAAYGGLSEWWYSPSKVSVTSLSNGISTTIAGDFSDLGGWTDINGLAANSSPIETVAFQAALADVTSTGLSFGSGNYYSDGFGFSTGNAGTVHLDAFSEVPAAVPLPSAAGMGLGLLGLIGVTLLRRKFRAV